MYFADILENSSDQFEVSDVEGGQRQLDMAKVSIAE